MGLALYIELEKEIPGFDPFVNGKAIARAGDITESLAKEIGVTPLMAFHSVTEELAEIARDEAGLDVEPGDFFAPEDGLTTIEALFGAIRQRADKIANAQRILYELDEYRVVLQRARDEGVKFRFAFDI